MPTKISQLPAVASLTGTEVIPVVTGGTTQSATVAQIRAGAGSTTPTGTGLRKVVSGMEQAAASLLVDADVASAAAIAGSKVSPNFGAQNVTTTGDVQGTNLVANGGYVTAGSVVAATGSFRTGATGSLVSRNGGNTADLTCLAWNGTTLYVGQDSAGTTQLTNVSQFVSSAQNFGIGATTYLSLTGNLVTAAKPIVCGTGTVASTGDIRLGNTGQINFDRTGSNILGLWMDTGTSLGVGNGNATSVTLYSGGTILLQPATNVIIGTSSPGVGGGSGVVALKNAATVPTSNPSGGGILYCDTGALKYRGSSGTVTTVGVADPHCPDCGRDFALEFQNNDHDEHLVVCLPCLLAELRPKRGVVVSQLRSDTKQEWLEARAEEATREYERATAEADAAACRVADEA